ncbi:MAG TPA: futalosine hydrolase [Puia sp.]|nr:futalosine hydrolase [Puia sp.]
MHILLIAASVPEIESTIEFFKEKKNKGDRPEVDIAISGIGLVATAYCLTRYIAYRRPDLIIQAGIAGSYVKGKMASVVSIREDMLADMGVREGGVFKTVFDLSLADENIKPFTKGKLVNPYQKLLSASGLEPVNAVSVNEVTTDKTRIEWYQQNFNPVVESMEGAAFHYVCLQEKIPFLQMRAISNAVGERDKSKWQIRKSIEELNEQLIIFLNKLTEYNATHFGI